MSIWCRLGFHRFAEVIREPWNTPMHLVQEVDSDTMEFKILRCQRKDCFAEKKALSLTGRKRSLDTALNLFASSVSQATLINRFGWLFV
jgi:hypothetical protein